MAAKDVKFSTEARDRMLRGVDTLANAVKVTLGKGGLSLVGAPMPPLAPGTYRVTWHAVSADTHRMEGAYTFTVR